MSARAGWVLIGEAVASDGKSLVALWWDPRPWRDGSQSGQVWETYGGSPASVAPALNETEARRACRAWFAHRSFREVAP